MAAHPELVAHCFELLAALGQPRGRRMFGGHGFYVDDHFIALLADDTLYLKTDDHNRAAFEAAGSRPFAFTAPDGKRSVMSYWSAPEDAMESPAQMLPWARLAMASALRAAALKRPAAARKVLANRAQTLTGKAAAQRAPAKLKPKPKPG